MRLCGRGQCEDIVHGNGEGGVGRGVVNRDEGASLFVRNARRYMDEKKGDIGNFYQR